MNKLIFFLVTCVFAAHVFASSTPNETNSSHDNSYLETYEQDENENSDAVFIEDEENEDSYRESEEVGGMLQYVCDGKTIFVPAKDRQWYDENCTLILDK